MECCENCVWSREKSSYACCSCLERSNFEHISDITEKQNSASNKEILDKKDKV
jgi:hypothetical protein